MNVHEQNESRDDFCEIGRAEDNSQLSELILSRY